MRLNLWDFDDTLAWSWEAVEASQVKHPQVKMWQWWHDPKWSTVAARITEPNRAMWKRLARTPGEHWVLTGRNGDAVAAWMEQWQDDPEIGPAIRQVKHIHSTSHPTIDNATVTIKKKRFIKKLLPDYARIHLYDDRPATIAEAAKLSPRVKAHQVSSGRVVNPRHEIPPFEAGPRVPTRNPRLPEGLTELEEHGNLFRTGRPVMFRFMRNTERTPRLPKHVQPQFGQDIEPAGRYMLHADPSVTVQAPWEDGHVAFQSPIVLEHRNTSSDAEGWKRRLSKAFRGRKGKSLSKALLQAGYDGIVTVNEYGTSEIVDLNVMRANPFKSEAQRRLFHAKARRGEISQATLREWEEATEGRKLPERTNPEGAALAKKVKVGTLLRQTFQGVATTWEVVKVGKGRSWRDPKRVVRVREVYKTRAPAKTTYRLHTMPGTFTVMKSNPNWPVNFGERGDDVSKRKKKLPTSGAARYKSSHWGLKHKRVYNDPDPLLPNKLVEMGKLLEIHVNPGPGAGGKYDMRFTQPSKGLPNILAFSMTADERMYAVLNPATKKRIKATFLSDQGEWLTLTDLADEAGGRQTNWTYPKVHVQPLGIVDAVVYKTHKRGDGPSEYIHHMGEDSGTKPLLGIDEKGRLWFAGGNYSVPDEGITD